MHTGAAPRRNGSCGRTPRAGAGTGSAGGGVSLPVMPPDFASDDADVLERPPSPGWSGGRRTVLLGLTVAVAVVVGAVAASVAGPGPSLPVRSGAGQSAIAPLDARPAPTDRMPLPDAPLAGFAEGRDISLADYRGAPLVVNLWATWCAPCVEEMPALQEVARAGEGQVAFLGVDVNDDAAKAEAFVERLGIGYDLAADPREEFARAVEAFGMPTTLFVGPTGTIVYRHTGPLDAAQLRALLGTHLGVEL